MKYLLTLTGLLMTHLIFTQNIKPTVYQENRIKEIFTPEYIIESSKPISIVIEQDSVIKVRDIQIEELNNKIKLLKEEQNKLVINLYGQIADVKNDIIEENSISDTQLKREKYKWMGLHLYVGTEIPPHELENLSINSELMYIFTKFEIGVRGEIASNIQSSNYKLNLAVKIRYKIF